MAKVEFTDPALKDLNGFDNSSRQAILLGLRKLEHEPQNVGAYSAETFILFAVW
jgi:phage-related protein